MLKRTLLPLAALMLVFVASAQPQRVVLDKVVAVVGSSSILHSELMDYAANITETRRSQGFTSDRSAEDEALELLLTQKLLYNQGQIDSVTVNQANIQMSAENELTAMTEAAGGVRQLEKTSGMAVFNLREIIRQRYEEQSYAQSMRETVVSGVKIVPGEVEEFYKRQDIDSLPIIGEQYMYAQITKSPKSIDVAKRRVRERLLDMRQRVISGQTRFDALARMYSVDPGSAMRGGEMEPQPATAFVGAFAEALESLEIGEVSEIVETEFGFHIIQLIDKQGALYHCRHILLRPVYTAEELSEPTTILDSIVGLVRADSLTFEQAVLQHSDDVASKMNGGVVSNHDLLERYQAYDAKLTETKFLKEDFGARGYKSIDDFNALSRLKEGEISNAFETEDMMGNALSKAVKLLRVIPAHPASLNEDYLRIEAMALQDKQNRVFKSWLKSHIDGMYIFIDPEYRSDILRSNYWVK